MSAARAWFALVPPIYLVAAAVIAGDAFGNLGVYLPAWLGWLATLASFLFFAARRSEPGRAIAIAGVVAAASVPAWRLHHPPPDALSLRRFPDRSLVTVDGRILAPPEHLSRLTHLVVTVDRAGPASHRLTPAHGLVRVTMLAPGDFRVGDEVRFTARMRLPYRLGDTGEFDYQGWLERNGIVATFLIPPHSRFAAITRIGYRRIFPASEVEAMRDHIRRFIVANLKYPESAEMRALVIGDRSGIDDALRQRFALTGMAHLLVISGLHLSFIAAAAFVLMRLVFGGFRAMLETGRANRFAASFAAVVVIAYAMIAGHHVSTMRALVVVLSYVLAAVVGRSREVMASLALAALIICAAYPGSSFDLGFQLSFASVSAIVLGMRRFMRWWSARFESSARFGEPPPWHERIALATAGYFAVSFWALVGTAPLTAFYFNQFSIVGLIANAVVVPIMGFCGTALGLFAAALSFIAIAPARVMLALGGLMLETGTWLAGWFLAWPLSWERIFTPTIFELALIYALIAVWLAMPVAARRVSRTVKPAASLQYVIGLLIILIIGAGDAAWWTHDRYFNPALRVTFLSVGEGDAAVVRFPGSRVMLIDAGGSFSRGSDPGERIVAPFLWAHKIMHVDYLALSHPDLDHFGGFKFIVENFSPAVFWMSGAPRAGARFSSLMAALARSGVRVIQLDAASPPFEVGGVGLRCLGPAPGVGGRRNNASMVLRLTLGSNVFLFTGDLEAAGERALLASRADLHATILKAPHHGSPTSSTGAFLGAVDPELAVISLGHLNRYGFPGGDVLARYRRIGAGLLRTDQSGEIEVDVTRGARCIRTFRAGRVPARLLVDPAARAVGRF